MRRCKHETARSKPTAERRICFKAEQALPKPTEFGLFNVHLLKVISVFFIVASKEDDAGLVMKTRPFLLWLKMGFRKENFDLKLCYLQQCPSPKLNDVTDNSADVINASRLSSPVTLCVAWFGFYAKRWTILPTSRMMYVFINYANQLLLKMSSRSLLFTMNLMELVSNSVRRLNDEIMLLFSGMKTRKVKIWTTRSTTKERSSFFDLWVDDVHVSGSRREKAEALRKTLLFAFLRCYIFKNPKICVLDERTRVKVQMACGHDVIERWMFSSPIFHETTSVEFGVSEFTVAATVWRYFSENKDRKNYYFYRSCTNDYIPGCTQLDDVEN
ncbi:hypothetical protein T4B_366 [Trichinella pseudospiralis]|uniref:Uncharacterized protein n=1 Tax=Trichinella pseudospiralis TaxID=6337 RepID=A0A0V1IIF8_TRIPS|nr:hypothetical protein T4B_366 [Trichinella pseudospiralis]